MNKILLKSVVSVVLACSLSNLWADAGTSGGSILNIGVGARAIGMGEAFTAMADDVSSLYWNPAGIALLNQSQASFMYNQSLKDLNYNNVSVATPLENGGIGASLSYLSFGKVDAFTAAGDPAGSVDAYSGVATVGAAWLLGNLSAGLNIKGVQGALADVKATGFASDFGLNYIYPQEVMGGTMRMAASYRNLGTGMKYIDQKDPFPSQWRVGVAALEMLSRKLNLSVDYGQERDLKGSSYGGLEYWINSHLALRAGYAGAHTESSGLRAGIGLKIKDLSFDYAYSNYGDLGMSHRYEMTMRFGAMRPLLSPEERRLYRRAKQAMSLGRYSEAVMLFDSLINLEPNYKAFRRWVKVAMKDLEKQEKMAQGKMKFDYNAAVSATKHSQDTAEINELENLLNLSDSGIARASQPGASPENKQ